MLQDKNAALTIRDPDLPGLAALLDADLLAKQLRTMPPFAGLRALTIDYIRYKPATSCVATLILELAEGQRYLAAKALTLARFEVSWRHPKRQKLVIERDPHAPLAIPELGIILSYPQHDRALPGLSLLKASPERDAQLRGWLPEIKADAPLELKILRYKPERRLLALLSGGGKAYATLRFASAERFGAMLTGNRLGHATGEIELLAMLPEQQLLITRWIEGESLCPEQGCSLPEQAVFELGCRLAGVHALSIPLPEANRQNGFDEARQVLNTLRAVAPGQVEPFSLLLARLEKKLTNRVSRLVPIHGDFTIDQVVRRDACGRLRLIDWDRARAGEAASDLATFQARLELQAIERTLTPVQVGRVVALLQAGYQRQRGELPALLASHAALALLRLAVEPFRKRAPEWLWQITALLQRADELIAEDEKPPPEAEPAAALSALLSKEQMAAPLRQALGLPASATLLETARLACKPGRRAVLAYRWQLASGELNVIGKYRHKGFEAHGFVVQQALWRDGFSHESDIVVPEPLAVLKPYKLWLQHKAAGKRVTDVLSPGSERLAEIGELVGKALGSIQHSTAAQNAVAGKSWTITHELAMLQQKLEQSAAARPAWAVRIAEVSRACEQLAQTLIAGTSLFLHRDFYPAQLLITEDRPGRLTLLDFDLAACGPAALDAGNYVAHLREQALRDYGDPGALVAHEDAFVAAWLATADEGDIANLGIFTTLALARHIAISLQFPDRYRITEALITLCEARLKRFIVREVR
ncbi:phosphotransferase [Kalamiella sp. sgz302252]|uniref:phosphotransferase n=1 Tax=Pantoea sp. sgz302252 TaxID=3341827 RepID=UPI0036D3D88E